MTQYRTAVAISEPLQTRDSDAAPVISGYFSVFGSPYNICPGVREFVDPHAFDDALSGDVRALINHDTRLVLGRTTAHTLQLRVDAHGLAGDITINRDDTDAMNLYARVQRGDVSQCSFGFDIVREDTDISPDGSVHWTIREVNLYEVSCCTFPAYESTNISARTAQRDEIQKRELQAWREKTKRRLNHGTESPDASEASE